MGRRRIKFIIKCLLMIILFIVIMVIYSFLTYNPYENTSIVRSRKPSIPWYTTNRKQLLSADSILVSPRTTKHIFWPNPPVWETGLLNSKQIFSGCVVKACEVHVAQNNKYSISKMDAVVFSGVNPTVPPILPRPQNQIWSFFSMESPYLSYMKAWQAEHWKNQINLTITYRLDSDIVINYGNVERKTHTSSRNVFEKVVLKKTKLVAWVVSHCFTPSLREFYAEELNKYISVDIYGFCGPCRKEDDNKLFETIENEYKFYLSFENAFCLDYVTEKFFQIQDKNLVAVVRGGADYTEFYPADTFINVDDFKSPKDLANYLIYLDKNTDKYMEYLSKKSQFKSVPGNIYFAMCELCTKLHNPVTKPSIYRDIYKWFTHDVCTPPKDIPKPSISTYIKHLIKLFLYIFKILC